MPFERVATEPNPYGPLVSFRTQSIFPPGAVYVGPGDSIEFDARSPSVSTVVQLTLRILTPQGEIKEIPETFTVATSGTGLFTASVPPTEGFILTAHASANNASRGQCFARCSLVKNPGQSQQLLGALLFQGYLSADDHLSYPQSLTESSLNGRGWTHSVLLANPGAGLPFVFTVPAGVRWIFKSVTAQLTTAGAAGTRTADLVVEDAGSNFVARVQSGATYGPTTFNQIYWMLTVPFTVQLSGVQAALPGDLVLPAGWNITGLIENGNPADAFTNCFAVVEEFVAH